MCSQTLYGRLNIRKNMFKKKILKLLTLDKLLTREYFDIYRT